MKLDNKLALSIFWAFVAYSLGHNAINTWGKISHTSIRSLTVSVQRPQEVKPTVEALLPPLELRR